MYLTADTSVSVAIYVSFGSTCHNSQWTGSLCSSTNVTEQYRTWVPNIWYACPK